MLMRIHMKGKRGYCKLAYLPAHVLCAFLYGVTTAVEAIGCGGFFMS